MIHQAVGGEYLSFLHYLKNGRAFNAGEIKDPAQLDVRAIDELLDRADVTIDPAARFKILGEAETVLTKEQPIVPIWRMKRNYLLHPAVHPASAAVTIGSCKASRSWNTASGSTAQSQSPPSAAARPEIRNNVHPSAAIVVSPQAAEITRATSRT